MSAGLKVVEMAVKSGVSNAARNVQERVNARTAQRAVDWCFLSTCAGDLVVND